MDSSLTIVATLSAPSTNFLPSDLVLNNATVQNFSGSGSVYTFQLVPTTPGNFGAGVPAGAFTDYYGTPNITGISAVVSRRYVPLEINWSLVTDNPGWSARSAHCAVVINDRLWLFGGAANGTRVNDVWYTDDGEHWTQRTPSAEWAGRLNATGFEARGTLWTIAGSTTAGGAQDAWYTNNGTTWTAPTVAAGFGKRYAHCAAYFNDKFWVFGGYVNGARSATTYTSDTGATWTLAASTAPWSARTEMQLIPHDGALYLMGGATSSATKNDVWKSTDGVNWDLAAATTPWKARQSPAGADLMDRMWLTSGYDGSKRLNDTWYSGDGTHWGQALPEAAPWTVRGDTVCVAWRGKLWVLGGHNVVNGSAVFANDVWAGEPIIPPDYSSEGEGEGEGSAEGEGEGEGEGSAEGEGEGEGSAEGEGEGSAEGEGEGEGSAEGEGEGEGGGEGEGEGSAEGEGEGEGEGSEGEGEGEGSAEGEGEGEGQADFVTILEEPAAMSVGYGDNPFFHVSVDSSPDATYQWARNGQALVADATYRDVDTSLLTVLHCSNANEGTYRCTVTAGTASALSRAATLTVQDPVFREQPVGQSVPDAGTATFVALAEGTPPLQYQWYKDGVALAEDARHLGTQTPTLQVSDVDQAIGHSDEGFYYCVVQGDDPQPLTSQPALLQIGDPYFTLHPQPVQVRAGQAAVFHAEAAGTPPILYRWSKDGIALRDDAKYAGTETDTLTVADCADADAGAYEAIAVGREIVESNPAALAIGAPPVIHAIFVQPEAGVGRVGGDATLRLLVSSTLPVTYQWYHDAAPISTAAALILPGLDTADSGLYSCQVSNAVGSATSASIGLRVGLTIVAQPHGLLLQAGEEGRLKVLTEGGSAPVSYQWVREDVTHALVPLQDGPALAGSGTTSLTLRAVSFADAGTYRVEVSDAHATLLSDAAQLEVAAEVPMVSGVGLLGVAAVIAFAGARRMRRK